MVAFVTWAMEGFSEEVSTLKCNNKVKLIISILIDLI
jgi:hypothetical protein